MGRWLKQQQPGSGDVTPNETYLLSALARGGLDKKKGSINGENVHPKVKTIEKKSRDRNSQVTLGKLILLDF